VTGEVRRGLIRQQYQRVPLNATTGLVLGITSTIWKQSSHRSSQLCENREGHYCNVQGSTWMSPMDEPQQGETKPWWTKSAISQTLKKMRDHLSVATTGIITVSRK